MHKPSSVKIFTQIIIKKRNMDVPRADNSVKNRRNLPISNTKPDLYNINDIPSLVKIHWYLLNLSPENEQMDVLRADNSVKIWQNLLISNQKQISTISMHKPSLLKILDITLSSGNENTDRRTGGRTTDRRTDGHTDGQPTWYHNTPPLTCGGV